VIEEQERKDTEACQKHVVEHAFVGIYGLEIVKEKEEERVEKE